MRKYWDDVLILGGGILIMTGFYFTWPPGVFFAGGVLSIALGILIGAGNRRPEERK